MDNEWKEVRTGMTCFLYLGLVGNSHSIFSWCTMCYSNLVEWHKSETSYLIVSKTHVIVYIVLLSWKLTNYPYCLYSRLCGIHYYGNSEQVNDYGHIKCSPNSHFFGGFTHNFIQKLYSLLILFPFTLPTLNAILQ